MPTRSEMRFVFTIAFGVGVGIFFGAVTTGLLIRVFDPPAQAAE